MGEEEEGAAEEEVIKSNTISGIHRRATVIVETDEGFLLVSHSKRKDPMYMLPGGYIREEEAPKKAAERELYEETGLHSVKMEYLFEVVSKHNRHIVFLAQTHGEAKKRNEITHIRYYNESTKNKYNLAWHVEAVIVKYAKIKKEDIMDKDPGNVSGICAGCERKFDVLYRKGRLYYCMECLTQIPEEVRTDSKKDIKTTSIGQTKTKDIGEGRKKKYPIKKTLIGIIFIISCVSVYSVYVEFLNQEININNIIIEPKEVLSGDIANIHVYVSKSSSVFGGLINLINNLVGYSEYFEINVNKEVFKEVVDIGVNENKTYTYPILKKVPGIYNVSVSDLSGTFNVLSMPKFEGYSVMATPTDPYKGEDIEVSILLENIGGIKYTQFLMLCIDDIMFKEKELYLEPGESKQVSFSVDGRRAGDYNVSFSWETGKKSLMVKIVEPVIDAVTGRYNFWIDGVQYSYYIGLVKATDGVIANSYGDFVVLINNKNATNPTYSQLKKFIKKDKTDEYPYQYIISLGGSYYGSAESNVDLSHVKNIIDGIEQINTPRICSDFAEMLHNNAEMSGFRCAYVSLEVGEGHALCAFNTTDKGIVYVDCTGYWLYGPSNCDKEVNVKVGRHYVPVSMFPEKGWSSTWEDMGVVTEIFMAWDGDWN